MNKPKLALIGFWARGNIGDELILQNVYKAFSSNFDLLLVLNEHGSCPGYWDWFPYNICERTDIGNIHLAEQEDISAVLVGGGGLGLGYGASHVSVAKAWNKKAFLIGVDKPALPEQFDIETVRKYYSLFDYVSFRTEYSYQWGIQNGINCNRGSDWTFFSDYSGPKPASVKDICFVVREIPKDSPQLQKYIKSIKSKIAEISKHYNAKLFLLPFSPKDELFLKKHFNFTSSYFTLKNGIDKIIKKLGSSSLIVSFGRLHPILLAKNKGIPVYAFGNKYDKEHKINIFSRELGIPFSDLDDPVNFNLIDEQFKSSSPFSRGSLENLIQQDAKQVIDSVPTLDKNPLYRRCSEEEKLFFESITKQLCDLPNEKKIEVTKHLDYIKQKNTNFLTEPMKAAILDDTILNIKSVLNEVH